MRKEEFKHYRSPEYLAAYFMNGHRQWVDGHLYEMFKKPNDKDGMICSWCQYQGHCPLKVREICLRMKPDKYFEYGLRCVK